MIPNQYTYGHALVLRKTSKGGLRYGREVQLRVYKAQISAVGGWDHRVLRFDPITELFAAELISRTPIFAKAKAKVTIIFSHVPTGNPTWPSKDYDYDARAKELTNRLIAACPGTDFTAKTALNADQAKAIMNESADADGYIAYVTGIWTGVPYVISRSGKPVVIVDDLYAGSGETLTMSPIIKKEKLPVVTVSSSDFQDVVDAARLFEVISSMKQSTVMDVVDYDIAGRADMLRNAYGTKLVRCTSQELAGYYNKADEKEAAQWADKWIGSAQKMVEPNRDEIIKSGKMYLALSKAALDNRADAVTVDCLGMFYSGRISAYPCLSHFQMNNDGGTGVCEGDIASTTTQLMMRYLTGRPGYVSDPVIDTSKDEIIYAHCVSHNRAFGPRGKTNPYIIRSHAEDGKGASVQSLLPTGEEVTTLIIDPNGKRLTVHSAKTVRNVDEPKACRTKLAAKANTEKILENWDTGWHRVTIYGDWRKQATNLAKLMGFSVFEEDKA